MDKKVPDTVTDTVKGICTLLGGALLLYPLIDEATKTLIPEMEKLKSGETLQELKLLPAGQERRDTWESKDDSERDTERQKSDNEIAELKRKLAEYESKSGEQSQ